MADDTHDVDTAARSPSNHRETYRPIHTDDRFRRRVRDDHATNAALHSALRAVYGDDPDVSINLMGSHAPGEKPHEPRYHVRVSLENAGMGEPSTGPTILDEMVARDDVVITKAYGGARYNDVTVHDDTGRGNDATPDDVVDAVEATIDQSVDRLTVHLRPVETRVEPVEVRVDDIPDRFVDVNDVEHDAARTLRLVVDEYGADSDRAHEVARSLATVVYTANPDRYTDDVDEPEAAPMAAFRDLWREAGVDPDTKEVSNIRPTDDGHAFEAPEDERTRDVVEAIRDPDGRVVDGEPFTDGDREAFRDLFRCGSCGHVPGDEVGGSTDEDVREAVEGVDYDVDDRSARIRVTVDGDEHTDVVRAKERFPDLPDGFEVYVDDVVCFDVAFPKTRPAEAAVRSYVERRLPDAAEDADAEVIADMVENFVVSGSVWGENAVFEHDESDDFDPGEAVRRMNEDVDERHAADYQDEAGAGE